MPLIASYFADDTTVAGTITDRASGSERFTSFSVPRDDVEGEVTEESIAAALGIQLGDTIPADLPEPVPDYVGFYSALLTSQT
jgi:hypothetical protein